MKKLAGIIGTVAFWFSFLVMIAGAVLFSVSGRGYQPLLVYGTVTFFLQLGLTIWHIRNERRQYAQHNQ